MSGDIIEIYTILRGHNRVDIEMSAQMEHQK